MADFDLLKLPDASVVAVNGEGVILPDAVADASLLNDTVMLSSLVTRDTDDESELDSDALRDTVVVNVSDNDAVELGVPRSVFPRF